MKSLILFLLIAFCLFLVLPFCSAAHYIVGIVNDAKDGTSANDRMVVLWNPVHGINDNLTDIIGVNGNSGTDNIYMIDCEMLDNECDIRDEIKVKVFGDYITNPHNLSVTGAGFDVMGNLTLNSPPNVSSIIVDDSAEPPIFPENEIDLVAASARTVNCKAVVNELDGDSLQNATAEFFHSSSFYGDSDDNNYHYTNNSCFINSSYGGESQSEIVCSFEVEYYATSGNWGCFLIAEDNLSTAGNGSDYSFINSLLSVGAVSIVDFGIIGVGGVSLEKAINVTNYGNVQINLSLSGYAISEGDGFAMNCSLGENILVNYEKYNVTDSNPGSLDLSNFENLYVNLTNSPITREFNLNYRQIDGSNDAIHETYWRIYVPTGAGGIGGTCQGNIVLGAVQAPEV